MSDDEPEETHGRVEVFFVLQFFDGDKKIGEATNAYWIDWLPPIGTEVEFPANAHAGESLAHNIKAVVTKHRLTVGELGMYSLELRCLAEPFQFTPAFFVALAEDCWLIDGPHR